MDTERTASINDMSSDNQSVSECSQERNRIVRQSTFLSIGAVGIFAAYSGVLSLQSSLNFDESLGTTSIYICFMTTIILNATLAPLFLQIFGAKFLLLVSDAAFLVFTLANLYPTKWTMYGGAVVLGLGVALVWPSVITFNSQFGLQYVISGQKGILSERKKIDKTSTVIWEKTRWFTGRFFAIFAFHQIIGNLIAYTILVFDYNNVEEPGPNEDMGQNSTEVSYQCGANDCYKYDSDDNNLTLIHDNLNVENAALRYGLFAVYALIQILSFVFHKVVLTETNNKDRDSSMRFSFNNIFHLQRKMLRHITSPLQLLLAPINIYNGMAIGFILGDLTRSFVSCPLGVEQVGLAMALAGVVGTLGSVLFQRLSGTIGRNAFFGIGLTMDVTLLVFCLFWQPMGGEKSWQIYLIVALFGFPDSIKQSAICATYPEYFSGNESVAFSTLSLCAALGMATIFGFGTLICVSTKIIVLLTVCAFSTVCYCGAEVYFRKLKHKKRCQEADNNNECMDAIYKP